MLNSLRTRIDTFKAVARNVHYIQGQSPKPNIREYFYYIDHHGQVHSQDIDVLNPPTGIGIGCRTELGIGKAFISLS